LIELAALVRCHRRAWTLHEVLSELTRYNSFAGLRCRILVMGDRISSEVCDVVHEHLRAHRSSKLMRLVYTHTPMLEPGRENFCYNQNIHLDALDEWSDEDRFDPRWVYINDDDYIFEKHRIALSLVPTLQRDEIDAYHCPTIYLVEPGNQALSDRHHTAIRLYRHQRGPRFSGRRMLSIPDDLHDAAVVHDKTAEFPVPLLEYGSYTAKDRRELYDAYARAGKVDAFTSPLIADPLTLSPFPDIYDPKYGAWEGMDVSKCPTA